MTLGQRRVNPSACLSSVAQTISSKPAPIKTIQVIELGCSRSRHPVRPRSPRRRFGSDAARAEIAREPLGEAGHRRLAHCVHAEARIVEGTPEPGPGAFPVTVDLTATPGGLVATLRLTEWGGRCTSIGQIAPEGTLPLLELYAGCTYKSVERWRGRQSRRSLSLSLPAACGRSSCERDGRLGAAADALLEPAPSSSCSADAWARLHVDIGRVHDLAAGLAAGLDVRDLAARAVAVEPRRPGLACRPAVAPADHRHQHVRRLPEGARDHRVLQARRPTCATASGCSSRTRSAAAASRRPAVSGPSSTSRLSGARRSGRTPRPRGRRTPP
jgi:hypothetical protein